MKDRPHPIHGLKCALESETDLATELAETLVRQRGAVARCDAAAVEDSVNDLTRLLTALDNGRGVRRELLRTLTGDPDAPLSAVADAPALETARARLSNALTAAGREAALQQHVLARALALGEASLRDLFTSLTDDAGSYAHAGAAPAPRASGVLLDRTA